MQLREICEKIDFRILAGSKGLSKEISGVYICDLLSWVMSHAKKGDIWITVQTHTNIIAIASLLELGCIIVPEDIEVEEDTLKRAEEEDIPVLQASLSAYQLACLFVELGIGK